MIEREASEQIIDYNQLAREFSQQETKFELLRLEQDQRAGHDRSPDYNPPYVQRLIGAAQSFIDNGQGGIRRLIYCLGTIIDEGDDVTEIKIRLSVVGDLLPPESLEPEEYFEIVGKLHDNTHIRGIYSFVPRNISSDVKWADLSYSERKKAEDTIIRNIMQKRALRQDYFDPELQRLFEKIDKQKLEKFKERAGIKE